MIMENLGKHFDNPLIFDLKGSTHNRETSATIYLDFKTMPRNKVYKDLDFINGPSKLEINEDKAKQILNSLDLETGLLEAYGIMDYSLIIFLEENKGKNTDVDSRIFKLKNYVGIVGIIDYLQTYTIKKKLENKLKNLKSERKYDHSCINPKAYRRRFLKMIANTFFSDDHRMYLDIEIL